jgi:putative nucleotidyltransferase with HDIG domain
VTQAVAILGFNPIRNLLLTSSVVHLLSPEETGELSRVKLWEHSVGTAVAAGLIARYTRHDDREELFVAGLLHDVGKLLEFRFLRPQFLEVLRLSHAEDIPIREAELRVLGFSHDQVGRVLGERWKLPLRLTETIAFHHHPDGAPSAPREAAIIHLADILSRALSLGSGGDDAVPPLDREAWDRVGLPLAVLEPLMDEIEAQYEYAVRSLMASSDKAAGPGQSGNRVQVG